MEATQTQSSRQRTSLLEQTNTAAQQVDILICNDPSRVQPITAKWGGHVITQDQSEDCGNIEINRGEWAGV